MVTAAWQCQRTECQRTERVTIVKMVNFRFCIKNDKTFKIQAGKSYFHHMAELVF